VRSVEVLVDPGDRDAGIRLWLRSVGAVWWRGNLRTVRVPALLFTVAFFPIFFLVAYSGLFPRLTDIPGFPADTIEEWFVPFSMVQAGAFSGLGAGFMTGNDIDIGFFDRLLLMPASRSAIYVGTVLMSWLRAIAIAIPVLVIGVLLGARLNGGVLGVAAALLAVTAISIVSASFALGVMYRVKDQRVAPLFQVVIFLVLFSSTATVPVEVATGWLHTVATYNPVTQILRLARQATLPSGVTWGDTWPGVTVLVAMVALMMLFALTGLRRTVP
jgi:ABC-type multidrug transport system permease subunit